jgi:NitT/TauT family transport system permease protein
MHKTKHIILLLLPGLFFLIFWQIMTQGNTQRLFFFSAPTAIISVFFSDIQTTLLWRDIAYTGCAALGGLVFGTLFGSILGIGLWAGPRFARISKPYIALLSAIPVFAIAPMMILWFGIGLLSKIVMAGFAVFLVASSQAYEGAAATASQHLLFARSLGAKQLPIIRRIILPGSLSWIAAGIRLNIGFALIGTFIAEFISSEYGLGHYILKAGGLYDMPRVFVGIILLTTLSVLATWGAAKMRRDIIQ